MPSAEDLFRAFWSHTFRNPEKYSNLEETRPSIIAAFQKCLNCPKDALDTNRAQLQAIVKTTGSKKVIEADVIMRYRGDWSAFDKEFLAAVRKDAADSKDMDVVKKVDAQIFESKLSAILRDILGVLGKFDLSPKEKRILLKRLSGSLGIIDSTATAVAPVQSSRKIPTKKGKNPPQPQNPPRSQEEKDLVKKVAEAQMKVRDLKLERGVKVLASDTPEVLAYQRVVGELNLFRKEKKVRPPPSTVPETHEPVAEEPQDLEPRD